MIDPNAHPSNITDMAAADHSDQQIMRGVQAEPTDDGIEDDLLGDLLEPEPLTEVQLAEQHNALMSSYYLKPDETAFYREVDGLEPVDEIEFQNWINGLSEAERARLDEVKQNIESAEILTVSVHDKLSATVPELYLGQLPPMLAERLNGAPYSLGFNQTVGTLEEAKAYLKECGGIDVTMYGYHHRFMMFDSSMVEEGKPHPANVSAVDQGYYGSSSVGRFVAAFPAVSIDPADKNMRVTDLVNLNGDVLPDDFEVSGVSSDDTHSRAVNSKYVAGFIDEVGDFWINNNFAVDSEPVFVKYDPTQTVSEAPRL